MYLARIGTKRRECREREKRKSVGVLDHELAREKEGRKAFRQRPVILTAAD